MKIIKVNTRHLGEIEVDFDTLSPAVQTYIIAYGFKQTVDDAGADPKKAADGSQARLDALRAGEVPAGGGGRLTELDKAIRDVVETLLRRTGVKAGEAAKAAREPEAAIRAAFGDKAEAIMAKVAQKAETLAASRRAAVLDIEV